MLFRRRSPDPREPVIRRVRDLEIASARLIRGGFAGDYHSAFHGRGIEFAQVREYFPGDDVRSIDWNVTARTGTPHVKEFVEERDLTVVIAVDVSGSMRFGSVDWRKCDIAAQLAAVFAFAAVQNADRVGLMLFSESVVSYLAPRRGRSHAQLVVRTAVGAAMRGPAGRADFDYAVRTLERVVSKRSVVLVLSDFLDTDPQRALRRLNRKHDVVAISIVDPREERLPERGLVTLVDAESGERALVDLSDARTPQGISASIERGLRGAAVDHLRISTAAPYDRELLRFFRERAARHRRPL